MEINNERNTELSFVADVCVCNYAACIKFLLAISVLCTFDILANGLKPPLGPVHMSPVSETSRLPMILLCNTYY